MALCVYITSVKPIVMLCVSVMYECTGSPGGPAPPPHSSRLCQGVVILAVIAALVRACCCVLCRRRIVLLARLVVVAGLALSEEVPRMRLCSVMRRFIWCESRTRLRREGGSPAA